MNWQPYNRQLDQLFDHSGFDTLDKLGFPIWENARDDEYCSALVEYHNEWATLTPDEKADRFMTELRIGELGLLEILNETDYSIVQ